MSRDDDGVQKHIGRIYHLFSFSVTFQKGTLLLHWMVSNL